MPRHVDNGNSRRDESLQIGELRIYSKRDEDTHSIGLRGELDLAHADDVERELKRVEATDVRSIILDLSGLTFMDSTGIRLVLEAQARSDQDSGRLVLLRASDRVQRVFRIAGIEDALPFAD